MMQTNFYMKQKTKEETESTVKMYKLIKCPNCKKFQITSAEKTFKCINCLKSKTIKNMKIYYENENPNLVSIALKKIKEEIGLQQNQNTDFTSALYHN